VCSSDLTQSISCTKNTIQPDGSSIETVSTTPSIALAAKDAVICTITNDDIPPTRTLRKSVVNAKLWTLEAHSFNLKADGPISISGTRGSAAITDATVPAGLYTLSEDPVDGYSATGPFVCTDGGNQVPVTNNQININP